MATKTRIDQRERKKLKVEWVSEVSTFGQYGKKVKFKCADGLFYECIKKGLFEHIKVGAELDADTQLEFITLADETEMTKWVVTELYQDGKPLSKTRTSYSGGGGKSPEELEQSLLTMCLAYAKDLAIADKIGVEGITNKADEFHKWVCSKKTSKAEIKEPAPKPSTPQVTKKTEPKAEAKGKGATVPSPVKGEDLFGEGEDKDTQKVPKTQEQLFNYVAKHAGHKDTTFTKAYLINKFKIPEKRIDEDIVSVYYEVKAFKDWPEYDGE